MDLKIGETLRGLRAKKGKTQEELAGFLGISYQAVSKWERGEGYPDITLLPRVAAYFGVSVDTLLGVDEAAKQEKLEMYSAESSRLSNTGDNDGNIALWKRAESELPEEDMVWFQLMCAYANRGYAKDGREDLEKSAEYAEKVVNFSKNEEFRYSAIDQLSAFYNRKGEKEKAREYAEMLPNMWNCREAALARVLEGEERGMYCKNALLSAVDLAHWQARYIAGVEESDGEKLLILRAAVNLLDAVFEDGDYGFYAIFVGGLYLDMAEAAAKLGRAGEAAEYLKKAAGLSVVYDTQGDHTLNAPLIRGTVFERTTTSKNYSRNRSAVTLGEIERRAAFDPLRAAPEYAEVTALLEKHAREG